jgi:hypothetical protein
VNTNPATVTLGPFELTPTDAGGGYQFIIDKLYGPTIFANLRITASIHDVAWLIERQRIDTGKWEIISIIPAVYKSELDDDDD